jgi:hypothetical protein
MDNVMTRYPLPPKKGAKKEEKKKEPVIPEPKIIPPETVEQAQSKTLSWNYAANIQSKLATGTLTTAKYHERV